jgi:MFS transporter, ACS family, tartrate transporter
MRAGTAGPGERVAAGPRPKTALQSRAAGAASLPAARSAIFPIVPIPEPAQADADAVLARAALAKVTRRLLPFLFLLYIVCFLDRVNIGFAALQMNRELGFSPAMYGLGAGIFFLGYVLCEIPSNLILARTGARTWIARIMVSWGLIACAMMFIRGPVSLIGLRFLLGAAEAGFFPGMIYYLTLWYPEAERARAVARFMLAIPLSGVVGGPISGALLELHGAMGLSGWQWLFLLEGIPAVLLGVVVFRVLPDGPGQATWLTPAERRALTSALAAERGERERRHGYSVRAMLRTPAVWQLAVLLLLANAFGVYVLGLWLPQIVRDVSGFGSFGVGLLSAIPNLVAAAAMVLVGAHSDRTGERLGDIAGAAAAGAVGLAAGAYLHSTVPVVIALSVAAAGLLSTHGPIWPLPATFLTGSAAAGGIAVMTSLANLGGFLGPYAVGVLKQRTGSFHQGLLLLALISLAGAALALWMRRSPMLRQKQPR